MPTTPSGSPAPPAGASGGFWSRRRAVAWSRPPARAAWASGSGCPAATRCPPRSSRLCHGRRRRRGSAPDSQEPSQGEHEDADGGDRHRVVQTNEDPVHGGASGLVVDPVFDGRRALPCRLCRTASAGGGLRRDQVPRVEAHPDAAAGAAGVAPAHRLGVRPVRRDHAGRPGLPPRGLPGGVQRPRHLLGGLRPRLHRGRPRPRSSAAAPPAGAPPGPARPTGLRHRGPSAGRRATSPPTTAPASTRCATPSTGSPATRPCAGACSRA